MKKIIDGLTRLAGGQCNLLAMIFRSKRRLRAPPARDGRQALAVRGTASNDLTPGCGPAGRSRQPGS